MDRVVGMVEAKSKLAELVGQVKYAGKRFVLERRGRPMAMLISVEEFDRLRAVADTASGRASALPPELRQRQERLVARALALRVRYPQPEEGLAELFDTLPGHDDPFWTEIQEVD